MHYYKITDIFLKTRRSQMGQMSKCPNITIVLIYWELSGEVSELRYKSLLYFSSTWSYCNCYMWVMLKLLINYILTPREASETKKQHIIYLSKEIWLTASHFGWLDGAATFRTEMKNYVTALWHLFVWSLTLHWCGITA